MKSDLMALINTAPNQQQAVNWMREYLQARILFALQEQGAMIPLAFHGGTALRFLYQLPRYSEDLVFSLENLEHDYDFQKYLSALSNQLKLEGYPLTVKFNDQKTVQHAFIGFPGLLYDLQLSLHVDQNFTVKLEVDTRPPQGAALTTSLIRYRELFLNLQHHDKSSLLAGKVHAVLQRKYQKGRDIYDLVWYLSDRLWPLPNFTMLNNALEQSGWEGPQLTASNWKSTLLEKLAQADFKRVRDDVSPFLTRPENQAYLQWDTLRKLLTDPST
jgi:predicted nucleotidyltransferase component of viral defense system